MEPDTSYIVKARMLVFDYVRAHLDKTDEHVVISIDDVYFVQGSKVLQNWKALVSTTLPDGMYYEVTYDGVKRRTYLDVYKKFDNVCIPDRGTNLPDVVEDKTEPTSLGNFLQGGRI